MFDTRYRPMIFDSVLGQDKIVKVLRNRIVNGTFRETSYVFSGPHGSGKTTLARIFARAMLCTQPDQGNPCNKCPSCLSFIKEQNLAFEERDAAGHGTIDYVRSLVDSLAGSLFGDQKIILFDEAHRMSKDAQDVLLKPIEDKKIVCIFCTTELTKLRPAIRSRCESFPIDKITVLDISMRLRDICAHEALEYDERAVTWIAESCKGHVRDGINLLEQVSKVGAITELTVKDYLGIGWSTEVLTVIESILADNSQEVLRVLDSLVYRLHPHDIYSNILENLVSLQLIHRNLPVASSFDLERAQQILSKYAIQDINRLMGHFNRFMRSVDRQTLICEVLLVLEKFHRNLLIDQQTVVVANKPMAQSMPLIKTNGVPGKDPEALTPIDHIGMNPSKHKFNNPTKVTGANVLMNSNQFRSSFQTEWKKD